MKVSGAGNFGFRRVFLRFANEATPPTASDMLCVVSESIAAAGWAVNNQCPCSKKNQYSSSGVCTDCHKSCEECSGPTAADCFACNFGYYHDGTQCQPCSSTCTDCGTCGICSEHNFYMDHTCVAKCDSPFVPISSGDRKFCFSPCDDTKVIYADGTCNTTCLAPFIYPTATDYTRQVCQSSCPTQTLFYDGTCSTSGCPYPLVEKVYGGSMKVCQYPCNSVSEVYYQHNSSCMPSCNFPYVSNSYGSFSACESPCPVNNYYRYWDPSCATDCPSLLQPEYLSDVWVCNPPKCGVVYCSACDPGNICPDYYHCNTTFGAFCMPYNTYTLQIEQIRPTLNGISLSVEVVPINGIRAIDDILDMSIAGLSKGIDYSVTIIKTSKGFYEVEITLLTDVNNTSPIASFAYGSNTLGLTSDYTLPRLTFINTNVQASASSTGKGSQIAFLIFLVTILGCIFGGGLANVWTAMPESQYSYYLLYINVDFLHHTEVYFESLSNYDILVGNSDEDQQHLTLTYRSILPRKFYVRDYAPDFLENTDQLFLQALISVSVLLILTLLVKHVRFSGKGGIRVWKFLNFIRKSLKWNLLIRQVLTYALPVSIAAFVQIYAFVFGQEISLISLAACGATLLAFLLCFKYMLSIIYHIPTSHKEMRALSQRFGTLWEDLDPNLDSRYYYWLVAVRGFLISYVAVFLSVYPYVQITVLIAYQCYIVSLFFKRFRIRLVFRDKGLNKVTLLEETCLLLVKVMILVYMAMLKSFGDKTIILVGWIIILPAIVAQVLQIFYSVWSQIRDTEKFKRMFEFLKENILGKKRLKKIVRIKRRHDIKIIQHKE